MVTKRQKEMLDYLQAFIAEHGYAPTLDEIGQHFSLASLATVHKHLGNLERKGFIRRLRHHSAGDLAAGGFGVNLQSFLPALDSLLRFAAYYDDLVKAPAQSGFEEQRGDGGSQFSV